MSRPRHRPRSLSFDSLEARLALSSLALGSETTPCPLFVEGAGALDRAAAHVESAGQRIAAATEAAPVDLDSFLRPVARGAGDLGQITSPFGERVHPILKNNKAFRGVALKSHGGVDVAAPTGTPIVAVADGEVVQVVVLKKDNGKGFGQFVLVDHGKDEQGRQILTRYAHASQILVKKGDHVTAGQTIALVGSTGASTRAHLHFELLRKEGGKLIAIDPANTGAFSSPQDQDTLAGLDTKRLSSVDRWQRGVWFDGTYVGGFSGVATGKFAGFPFREAVSGTVRFSVANRQITVLEPGGGSGTVSASGAVQIRSASGTVSVGIASCKFGGQFMFFGDSDLDAAGVFASGGWSCQIKGDGISGSARGQWNAAK